MKYAIIDCYTDEPSGLGVPPYLGTYPRYIYGALNDGNNKIFYLTIDDLRNELDKNNYINRRKADPNKEESKSIRTDIKRYNLTINKDIKHILDSVDEIIVVAGINTPGKYLSGVPGSLNEIGNLIERFSARKILTGPAAIVGSRMEGGRMPETLKLNIFDVIDYNYLNINEYDKLRTERSGEILKQIPYKVMLEIELGKGCDMGKCSFCTEPLKNRVSYRKKEDIINEVKSLKEHGGDYFRLGKVTCFYSYDNGNIESIGYILREISKLKPKVLHIDNVNPNKVLFGDGEKITKLICEYCTPGNIASFGVESFDIEIVKKNRLNISPDNAVKAIRIINRYGKARGNNGMPLFLPGINIILGLIGENKKTLDENYRYLKMILDEGLLLRRINIRQVVPFEGTLLYEVAGLKYIKKNKKRYYSWRKKIREEIDYEMLKRIFPKGTILKDVQMEVHNGNRTFGRQLASYPIVVGVKERLELRRFYDIKVVDWMLRSIVGETIES